MRPAGPQRPDLPGWATVVVAILIAVGPPLGQILGSGDDIGGVALAAWFGAGVLLTRWVLSGTPPVPALPAAGHEAVLPVAVLCAVSLGTGLLDGGLIRSLVPFVLACVAPVVIRFGDGAVPRFAARLGQVAGTVVSLFTFTVLGLVAVCLPWLAQRPLRVDPVGTSGAWLRRERRAVEPARSWSPDPASTAGRPLTQRAGTAALACVAASVLVLTLTPIGETIARLVTVPEALREPFRLGADIAGISTDDLDDLEIRDRVDDDVDAYEPGRNDPQAAMASSAWFNETNYYNTAQGWAFEPDGAWRAANPYRLLDFRSRLLNVVDGSRTSWIPPACACRRLTVWMYGGSTTYGLNQRDGHTIASELARVAHEHGVTIDIDNRGALGHLHWMEAERFAWDLTVEEAPDMVIFYDGVNEIWAAATLNTEGWGDIEPMIDPTTHDMWADTGRSQGGVPDGPPGSELTGRPDDVRLDLGDLERTIVERYDRSRALSRTAAEAHGVDIRYLWQPSRFSRPLVESEPHTDGRGENYSRASEQLILDALPDDVIDVSDALRGTDEPLFTDDVHHNELGARLIAEMIYERIGDDLEALSS